MLPGQKFELRGPVRCDKDLCCQDIIITPCPEDRLPTGLKVEVELLPTGAPHVKLNVHNTSEIPIVLCSNNVLAELHLQSQNVQAHDDSITMDGVVGPACESDAFVNDVPCRCLLDSGSQITTISRSFYNQNLSKDVQLEPIPDEHFSVWGAGGQKVAMDGLARVSVKFSKSCVGSNQLINTVAVVCPDTAYTSRIPMIVGTNTFRLLRE